MTASEELMLARRLRIAQMLLRGFTQNEIRLQLRVSPNTVWKVNLWLVEQMPEYEDALKKTAAAAWERTEKQKRPVPWYRRETALPFAELRRRYPLHFLLFNIADEILVRRRREKAKKKALGS